LEALSLSISDDFLVFAFFFGVWIVVLLFCRVGFFLAVIAGELSPSLREEALES